MYDHPAFLQVEIDQRKREIAAIRHWEYQHRQPGALRRLVDRVVGPRHRTTREDVVIDLARHLPAQPQQRE